MNEHARGSKSYQRYLRELTSRACFDVSTIAFADAKSKLDSYGDCLDTRSQLASIPTVIIVQDNRITIALKNT